MNTNIGSNRFILKFLLGLTPLVILFLNPAQVSLAQATDIFFVEAGDVDGLIAAITAANDPINHPRADKIVLGGGVYTLTTADPLGGSDGPTGLPSITSKITITGNGAIIERADGIPDGFRIFHIAGEGSLTMSDITIRGGTSNGFPAGGGILNRGTLSVTNSTVSNNSGAGISNFLGTTTLINITMSGNGGSLGGALHNVSTRTGVKLINSTISENTAGFGGGIYNFSGPVEMVNTIVAHNSPGGDCSGNPITSLGHNMDSDGTCDLFATGDLPYVEPLLGPLQDNGGPTSTFEILSGSPALDAGDGSACPSIDQRGITRPQGTACDIGSYESDTAEYSLKLDQGNVFPEGGLWSIQALGPVGQEFVPTLAAVNLVELWTEDGGGPLGVDLQVLIRADSITGPILGTSSIVTLPDGFKGATRFGFAETVSLIPGDLYVLEVTAISGDNWMAAWYNNTYPFGSSIVNGEISGTADLWFREWALIRRTAEVDIDILPGTFPNRIDPGDDGFIPVAILTTDEFDAALIDPLSVKFGPGGAPDSDGIGQIVDIDSDGDLDLVLSFSTQETGIQCGETTAALTGETFVGQMIEGSDTILTARC